MTLVGKKVSDEIGSRKGGAATNGFKIDAPAAAGTVVDNQVRMTA
jgi:hypothetical protein